MESEFLTVSTQKLRKSLLVASLVGFAISYAGLRVSEVSLLGSKLAITKFEVIPFVLGIIVLYFLMTFIIFGLYDYSQSYRKLRKDYVERLAKGTEYSRLNTEKALKDLRDELMSLHSNMETWMAGETTRLADRDRAREIEQEISKLNRVSDFYEYYTPFWGHLLLSGDILPISSVGKEQKKSKRGHAFDLCILSRSLHGSVQNFAGFLKGQAGFFWFEVAFEPL